MTATWVPVLQFQTAIVPFIIGITCDQPCSFTMAAIWSQQTAGASANASDVPVPVSKEPE
jgi:hypothetical protein